MEVWLREIKRLGPSKVNPEGGSRSKSVLGIQEKSGNLVSEVCLIHFLSSLFIPPPARIMFSFLIASASM